MPDAPPRFSLVIATMGRPTVLGDTLASAARSDPPPAEVIVVDGDESGCAEPVVCSAGARYERSAPRLTVQRNAGLEATRWEVRGSVRSPVRGRRGAVEYLLHARRARPINRRDFQ